MLPEDGKEGLDKRFTRDQRDAFKKLISGEETQVAGKEAVIDNAAHETPAGVTFTDGYDDGAYLVLKTSPLRQPLRARNRPAATAGSQIPAPSAARNASPRAAYSSSESLRSRLRSANRWIPCAGLSARMPRRRA